MRFVSTAVLLILYLQENVHCKPLNNIEECVCLPNELCQSKTKDEWLEIEQKELVKPCKGNTTILCCTANESESHHRIIRQTSTDLEDIISQIFPQPTSTEQPSLQTTPGFGQQGSVSLESLTETPINVGETQGQNQERRCGQLEGLGVRLQSGNEGKIPWFVRIWSRTARVDSLWVALCGGSLILENVVLTAAHCIKSTEEEYLVTNVEETQRAEVLRTIVHPNFNSDSLKNDVALLFLSTPMPIGSEFDTGIICLPPPGRQTLQQNDVVNCLATGFDNLGEVLNVEVPLVPHGTCQRLLRRTKLGAFFKLDNSFVCAGGESGRDTCQGDGGSPLLCLVRSFDAETVVQVGLVSWGVGCGTQDIPGVYASTNSGIDWINSEIEAAGLDSAAYRAPI